MSIITISRGTFSGGKEFAENLAKKLGYRCLSREELSEEAIKLNVPVGKLQTAMVKPPRVYQRMIPQREFYLSCITSILCKYILEGPLVYHGHTGHLLLPGIPNIFRIRVVGVMEHRIEKVMTRLGLSQEKAIEYINNVDNDRDKWVRFLYGVDWHDPSNYDIVINLDQVGVANTSTALCTMAELPDFKLTPAAKKALQNLYLSSHARFLLAHDARTSYADFKVTANEGIVQVTCLPQYSETAEYVAEVLRDIEECSDVRCTIAGSSILWLGEKFDVKSELFSNVVRIAKKWDAAVELLEISVTAHPDSADTSVLTTSEKKHKELFHPEHDGGIGDDDKAAAVVDEKSINPVLDKLLAEGCSGGSSTVYGDQETLLTTLGHRSQYRLVVIGDLFLAKTGSTRTRMTSEMRRFLADSIKAPVVSADELKQELGFKLKDLVRLSMFFMVACVLFIIVFMNQKIVLEILAGESYKQWRILAIILLLLFVPTFAYAYGSFARQIFRFFKFD